MWPIPLILYVSGINIYYFKYRKTKASKTKNTVLEFYSSLYIMDSLKNLSSFIFNIYFTNEVK